MEDSTQKQVEEPLEVPQQCRECLSWCKLEPIPSRLLLPRPVDPTLLLSTIDPFFVALSHSTPSSPTVKSFSLVLSYFTPLSSTIDSFFITLSHLTLLLSIVDPFSVASSQCRLYLAFLRLLIPIIDLILSLSDILVVTTTSNTKDNLCLFGIHSRSHRPHIQITPISETTPTLVPGSQS